MGIDTRSAAIAACLVLSCGATLAQDFTGSFKGTEKVTVSNCGSYDGTTTGPWEVTHTATDAKTYGIKGSTAKGTFTGTGQFEGNASTAAVNGIDKAGSRWTARSKTTVDGDKLTGTSSGEVTGTSCVFAVEMEAVRQP